MTRARPDAAAGRPASTPAGETPTRTPWAALALVLVAFVLRFGYAYGTGDHDEMLPQVLRWLDGDLFARDWFVMGEAGRMTVRVPFLLVLRGLSTVLPLEGAVLLLWLATLAALAWGLYRLAFTLYPDRLAGALAVLAALVFTNGWTLGGNGLAAALVVPEPVAWALAVPALTLFVRGRRLAAAALLGVAAWVQLLVGLLTAFALGAVWLWEAAAARSRAEATRAVAFGVLFFAVAAPVFGPTVVAQLGAPAPEGALSSWYVIAALRQPHHYLLFSFGPRVWAQAALLTTLGLAAFFFLRRRDALGHTPFLARFLAVVGALCGVYLAFTEGIPSLTVAKLQFYKLTVPVQALLASFVAFAFVEILPSRVRAAADRVMGSRSFALGAAALVALTAAAAVADLPPVGARIQPHRHRASDLHAAERWARDSTATDALFLIPPSETTFRTWARRSVVINDKPTPFRDAAMHERFDRLRAVAPAPLPARGIGFTEAMDAAYHAHASADWARLARRFGADYALVDTTRLAAPPGALAFAQGRWGVYRLAP